MSRGYFGIGIVNSKTPENIGTLWRSANQFGASFIFTVGARYPKQCSDTLNTPKHLPLYHYQQESDINFPLDCPVVGIEMGGKLLEHFKHPERAIYLLGAEDHGLPSWALRRCHQIVSIPSIRTSSFNVAVAGSIVMYDRMTKSNLTPKGA